MCYMDQKTFSKWGLFTQKSAIELSFPLVLLWFINLVVVMLLYFQKCLKITPWKQWFTILNASLCEQMFPHKYLPCFFSFLHLQYSCRGGNSHISILRMPKPNDSRLQLARKEQNSRQTKALEPSQDTTFLQTNTKMIFSEIPDGKYTWF